MVVGYSPNVATSMMTVSPRYLTLPGGLVQKSKTHSTASTVVKTSPTPILISLFILLGNLEDRSN